MQENCPHSAFLEILFETQQTDYFLFLISLISADFTTMYWVQWMTMHGLQYIYYVPIDSVCFDCHIAQQDTPRYPAM